MISLLSFLESWLKKRMKHKMKATLWTFMCVVSKD
jgi:hypothetical protein